MARRRRAHGSIYKRRRPDKTIEDVWTISWYAAGRRYVERAFTDRAASEQKLSQNLRQAARDQVGIGDPFRKHRSRPIKEHLDDFLASLGSRHVSPRYKKLVRARLLRAFEAMGATVIGDLELAKADLFLADLIEKQKQSVATRDHYAMALRQFGLWLLDNDRSGSNVFHRLRGVATAADVKRERMPLTAEQVQQLVKAAAERPVFEYRKSHPQGLPETFARLARNGRHRGLLYLFAALTGLRRAECAGIRWADLNLGPDGSVTARAKTTKSKRRDPLPLEVKLAAELLAWRKEIAKERRGRVPPATEAVFHVPQNLTEQLRKDAKHVEIPEQDDHGRTLDFHSLRASFVTMLARAGVPMQLTSRLARHTDPKMTAKHYEKLGVADLRAGSVLLGSAFWGEAPVAPTAASEMRTGADAGAQGRNEAPDERSGTA